jgi:hypothetical protein
VDESSGKARLLSPLVEDTENDRAVAKLPSAVSDATSSDGLTDEEGADAVEQSEVALEVGAGSPPVRSFCDLSPLGM